mmetsp:Transcript_51060/g.91955  ORF Transcript_51060/g.91955 Transcript_51060/m.91955 type:complete len:582 (-) Transcript_51060:127-1872(-)
MPSANAFHVKLPARMSALSVALLLATISECSAGGAVLRAGRGQGTASDMLQGGAASSRETMDYLLKTLGKFQNFAQGAEQAVSQRHQVEELRLQTAMASVTDETVKEALELSVKGNEESLRETQRIYSNIASFSGSMVDLLKSATKKGYGCGQLTCGLHASCTDTMDGASCVCNEGYIGQGKDCRAPPVFMPHLLASEGSKLHVADMHVTLFDDNKIAIVFRDVTKGNVGSVVVGKVREAGLADLSPPEQFTAPNARAFSPVVTGTDGRRIAIAWRDEDRTGTCKLRAAVLGATKIRGAEMALTWGDTVDFCNNQAHKMSISSFPNDRIMILFSDKAQELIHLPLQSFGNSLLADIGPGGVISTKGTFRFTDSAVTRIEASKISPSGFVLAMRASSLMDDMNPSMSKRQEALAMYGELVGDDLVFDPNPANLEPEQGQMWSRGISLIAPNTFAYAYQDGAHMQMKMAVLEINAVTHRLEVVSNPTAVNQGFSPYVSMLSTPYTSSDPHTLMYYQGADNSSMVNICAWSAELKSLDQCQDFVWLTEKLSSVSGVHLGGGKSFMAFASESGTPYYSVFGLAKK